MVDTILEQHSLLRACIEALGINVVSYEEELKMSALFYQRCPISRSGRVDWKIFDRKIEIGYEPEDILPAMENLVRKKLSHEVYIEWDTHIPLLKTTLDDIIKNFDVVVCVSPRKFIFNLLEGYVLEVLQSGQMTAGIFPTSDKFFQKETYINPNILKDDVVFGECIEALKIDLLPTEEEKNLDTWFKEHCPMTKWGRVDWDKFSKKEKVGYEIRDMKRALGKFLGVKGPYDTTAYIEWGEVGIPVIKTTLGDIIGKFEDVAPVAFEKFVFNPELGYVIEILHSREITMGMVPKFEMNALSKQ